MHLDIFTPGTYLLIVLLCLTIDAPLTVRHLKYSRTITTGRGFVSRKKITSAMSKLRKQINGRQNVQIVEEKWHSSCMRRGPRQKTKFLDVN